VKLGFIGLGLIGRRRLEIARAAGHDAVFGVDPERPSWPGFARHGMRMSAHHADVGDQPVDAVFVALPHDLAAPAARWALERGAHVLCEKPLGLNPVGARRLCQTAAQRRLCLAVGFNYRFLPSVVRLRALLAEGALGTAFRGRFYIGHGGRPGMEKEWKLNRARAGGGAVMDPGIHLLDLVRLLLGEARVMECRVARRFWRADVEDEARVELQCAGADVSVEISMTSWRNQFQIDLAGEDGMASISGRGGNYGPQRLTYANRWFWQPGNDRRLEEGFGDDDPSFVHETEAFLQWVAGGPRHPALATGEDGLAAAELVEAIYARSREALTGSCASPRSGHSAAQL
jgi:predicted dehydrogenase